MSRIVTSNVRALTRRLVGRGPEQAAPLAAATPARALLELSRGGSAPLSKVCPDARAPLEIATLIPSFRRGSGGHTTIVRLLRELRDRGHHVSLWLEDCEGRHVEETPVLTEQSFRRFFASEGIPFHRTYRLWERADVVLATGWQTVPRALLLPGAGARAYLVQDHEPDFYGASVEALWAADTYRRGIHCIAASPWLAELLRTRYGARTSHFDLGVDRELYRPGTQPRRDDLVVFYARASTPRRAVPLGLAALEELARRRPDVEIALFGEAGDVEVPFAHRWLGVLDERQLALLYAQAAVGVVFSLTNPSLTSLEMMASGLPCIELASESMLASHRGGAPVLCAPEPLTICAAIERLLDERPEREKAGRAGIVLTEERSWRRAGEQLEAGLREAVLARG